MTEHMQLTFEKTTTTNFNELHNDIRALHNDIPSSNLHKDVGELHEKLMSCIKSAKALVGKVLRWKWPNKITCWYLPSDYTSLQLCCVL